MPPRILILFAHPALEKSHVNILLIDSLQSLDAVTFVDLYQEYPDHDIDIQVQQELLLQHQLICFHHPFFWYSTPPILKEWQDLVLEHGWAYGSHGNMLMGKDFMNIVSTGGKADAYTEAGYNGRTVRELLAPIEQTATLCKMNFLAPFIIHGTHSITEDEVHSHRIQLIDFLTAYADQRVDRDAAKRGHRINDRLGDIILETAGGNHA